MHSFWVLIRWRDVVVGAVVWALFLGEWVGLDLVFPSTIPGCEATAVLSCWDVTGLVYGLLSIPFWYVLWARLLRPCPWQLRWLTPFAVSYAAYRVGDLCRSDWRWQVRLAVLAAAYVVAACAMSALNARAQAAREGRS